jgi:hypothetical protein
MKASPPRWLERIVGWLIPPVCREVVLGDLHERYRGVHAYISDAVYSVPGVVWSRIRRTTDPGVRLLEAFSLYLSFLIAAWVVAGVAFLMEPLGLLRLAIPAIFALGALMLADAYAQEGQRSSLRPFLEATIAVGAAVIAQTALAGADQTLALPDWILFSGGGFGVVFVATLRMLFPPTDHRPRGAT